MAAAVPTITTSRPRGSQQEAGRTSRGLGPPVHGHNPYRARHPRTCPVDRTGSHGPSKLWGMRGTFPPSGQPAHGYTWGFSSQKTGAEGILGTIRSYHTFLHTNDQACGAADGDVHTPGCSFCARDIVGGHRDGVGDGRAGRCGLGSPTLDLAEGQVRPTWEM